MSTMLFKSEALLKRYQGFALSEGQHKALAVTRAAKEVHHLAIPQ